MSTPDEDNDAAPAALATPKSMIRGPSSAIGLVPTLLFPLPASPPPQSSFPSLHTARRSVGGWAKPGLKILASSLEVATQLGLRFGLGAVVAQAEEVDGLA
jgi:hypothetical protein